MFDTLTDRLNGVFKKLRSRGKLHPKQVDHALAEMRTALLEADVAIEVADDLLSRVRGRALSEEVMKSLTPGQQIVKVVNEELTATLGEHRPFTLPQARPAVVMMAGVQGSGKTTACAKLALLLKGKGAGRCSSRPTWSARRPSNSCAPSVRRSVSPCSRRGAIP